MKLLNICATILVMFFSVIESAVGQTGAMTIVPDTLRFKQVHIGEAPTMDFTITNLDTASQQITGMEVSAPYTVTLTDSLIAPGGSLVSTVSFQPTEVKWYAKNLTITTSADSIYKVRLTGGGIMPPPILVEFPVVENVNGDSATIRWKTDRPATSQVYYKVRQSGDTYTSAGDTVNLVTDHLVVLTPLITDSTYVYYIESVNEPGGILKTRGKAGQNFTAKLPWALSRPPKVTNGPTVVDKTDRSVHIKVETDPASYAAIEFGIDSTLAQVDSFTVSSREHLLAVENLESNTKYFYRLRLTNTLTGNVRNTTIRTFRTKVDPDSVSPVLVQKPVAEGITTTSSTIMWTTDKATDAIVAYGPDSTCALSAQDADFSLEHSILLTDLQPKTKYYYYIESRDVHGNLKSTQQWLRTFRTLAARDEVPPMIVNGPYADGRTDTQAIIRWQTNEVANGILEFGTDTTMIQSMRIDNISRWRKFELDGLTPDTQYYYRVSSSDRAGNTVVSIMRSFKTKPAPDTVPPVIVEAPVAMGRTNDQANIKWKTDEQADALVDYGLTVDYTDQVDRTSKSKSHVLRLTNLLADTLYHYRVQSSDMDGNTTTSEDYIFRTNPESDIIPPQFVSGPGSPFRSKDEAVIRWKPMKLRQVKCNTALKAKNSRWLPAPIRIP